MSCSLLTNTIVELDTRLSSSYYFFSSHTIPGVCDLLEFTTPPKKVVTRRLSAVGACSGPPDVAGFWAESAHHDGADD